MPSPYDFYNIEPDIIGFYITAYGIAVKHGFVGTEPEWIASLKGEQGTATEMRYNSGLDRLEWKLVTDSEWTGVLPLSVIRGTAFDEAVASIQTSTVDARQSKEAAAVSATEARNQAERANAERQGAEVAKNSAESAKTGAEQAKDLTVQLKADTNEIRLQAEAIKEQAKNHENIALTARSEAEGFSEVAGQKSLNASLAEQNAREHMQSAWEGKTLSQSWAVGGTGQREGEDTNNAKYWSDRAKDVAGGGVTSFNGRTGAIVPQASDYSEFFPQPIQLANDLTTTTTGKALDASQGSAIKELIDQANQKANEAFTSASNGKNAIADAITGKGISASNTDTFPILADKITQIRHARGIARPSQVLAGKTFSNFQGEQRGTMPDLSNWSLGMSASGTVTIPRGFHSGGGKVTAQTVGGKTILPSTSQQTAIGAGYMARENIMVAGDSDLIAGNIKDGASIFGVSGTYGREEKALIANAITGKGVATSTTASWQTMAENIKKVGSKKKVIHITRFEDNMPQYCRVDWGRSGLGYSQGEYHTSLVFSPPKPIRAAVFEVERYGSSERSVEGISFLGPYEETDGTSHWGRNFYSLERFYGHCLPKKETISHVAIAMYYNNSIQVNTLWALKWLGITSVKITYWE